MEHFNRQRREYSLRPGRFETCQTFATDLVNFIEDCAENHGYPRREETQMPRLNGAKLGAGLVGAVAVLGAGLLAVGAVAGARQRRRDEDLLEM